MKKKYIPKTIIAMAANELREQLPVSMEKEVWKLYTHYIKSWWRDIACYGSLADPLKELKTFLPALSYLSITVGKDVFPIVLSYLSCSVHTSSGPFRCLKCVVLVDKNLSTRLPTTLVHNRTSACWEAFDTQTACGCLYDTIFPALANYQITDEQQEKIQTQNELICKKR
jgi:hypothetical protein